MTAGRESTALRSIAVIALLLAMVIAGLVYLVRDSYEMTRLRNAFLAVPATAAQLHWAPDAPPPSFRWETRAAPGFLRAAADAALAPLPQGASTWDRALALARHLNDGDRRSSGGILSDTIDAYRQIREHRRGYCADYTQVLNGLAHAAGVPVREWGMSFDGYSGRGHAFSEVYDDQRGQWAFLDSYYSFYVVDAATSTPLSVLELRQRLQRPPGMEGVRIEPTAAAQFAFPTAERAIAYYRRGADQFFLVGGNDVLTYDAHPVLDRAGDHSRALEQGLAMLLGVQPPLLLVPDPDNAEAIAALDRLRVQFAAGVIASVLLTALLLLKLRRLLRASGT